MPTSSSHNSRVNLFVYHTRSLRQLEVVLVGETLSLVELEEAVLRHGQLDGDHARVVARIGDLLNAWPVEHDRSATVDAHRSDALEEPTQTEGRVLAVGAVVGVRGEDVVRLASVLGLEVIRPAGVSLDLDLARDGAVDVELGGVRPLELAFDGLVAPNPVEADPREELFVRRTTDTGPTVSNVLHRLGVAGATGGVAVGDRRGTGCRRRGLRRRRVGRGRSGDGGGGRLAIGGRRGVDGLVALVKDNEGHEHDERESKRNPLERVSPCGLVLGHL